MKKAFLLVALLLALGACDDIQIKSYEVKERHALVGWTQTDLGGGVYSDVSADWSVTNDGDMWFWSRLGVSVSAGGETYLAGTPLQRVEPGQTITGTVIIDTETALATDVTVVRYNPDVTEPD